jgi:hypothetical protein
VEFICGFRLVETNSEHFSLFWPPYLLLKGKQSKQEIRVCSESFSMPQTLGNASVPGMKRRAFVAAAPLIPRRHYMSLLAVCFDRVTADADWLRNCLASRFIIPAKLSNVTIIINVFCYFSLFHVFIIFALLYMLVHIFLHLFIIR